MYEVMASRTMRRRVQCACVVLLALGAARADSNVTIESMQVTFEETHELVVNASVEFILTFAPHPGQGVWPIRVWIKTDGGDTSRPLLVTARRRIGAWTWQLPYRSGSSLLYQLERTLCPDDSVDVEKLDENCESDDPSASASGEFSLHVGSSCAAPSRVQLRASFVRDWRLPFKSSTSVVTQQGAPRVHTYQFLPEQYSVRLVVEASDDVCATIAVQNYTCPIAESLEEIEISTLRMTVLRSGAMQISRSRYPRGFYVLAVVHDSDAACREEDAPEVDWLWEAAVLQQLQEPEHSAPPRRKALTLHVRASLSREQYAGAAAASLALFVMFYVLFGAFVLAQRLPRWKNLVGPRAVLARKPEEGARSEIDSVVSLSPRQRRRRDSTATFDSSDNSDTDEEDTATGTTTVATVATPPPAVVAVSTQDETNPGSRSAVSVGTDPAPPLGDGVTTRVDSSVVPGGDDTRRSAIEQSTQTSNDGGPAAVRAAGAAARGGAGAAARARAGGALGPLPVHAVHRRPVLRAARAAVRRRLPDLPQLLGVAGHLLLQLPVCAPGVGAVGLQPRVLQHRLPLAGRAVHAAGAPPQDATEEEAQRRGVRDPGTLRAAVVAGRRHDDGGATVRHLPRLPQRTQLPIRHGVHVRAGSAVHGEDLPGAPPRHQRARPRHLRRAGRAHLARGVGRAGRRAAVLERLHRAARLHLPAAVAAHLLRRTIPPREAEPGGGGARAGVGAGARPASAVLGAPRHAAHRQRRQLGLRALRTVHAERGLRVAPAVGAAVQHAAVHGGLPLHEAAARRAPALVRLALPCRRHRRLDARTLLLRHRQHRLGDDPGAVPAPEPRVPRATVLRLARLVALPVGHRSLLHLQRPADVGRRARCRQTHRNRRLLINAFLFKCFYSNFVLSILHAQQPTSETDTVRII